MKKTNMKFVLILFSFVAFATTNTFSQNYVSVNEAIPMLSKYHKAADVPLSELVATSASIDEDQVMNRYRVIYSKMILVNLKEGMSVAEALNAARNDLTGNQSPSERLDMLNAVEQEIIELLTDD